MLCGDEFLKCGENVTCSLVIGYEVALHKIRLPIPGCIYSKPQAMSNLKNIQRAWTGNHVIVVFTFKVESVN